MPSLEPVTQPGTGRSSCDQSMLAAATGAPVTLCDIRGSPPVVTPDPREANCVSDQSGAQIEAAQLGQSDLAVSRLIFGGASIGGLCRPVSAVDAEEVLNTAWDLGVRTFDTAPHYGVGLSESRLGGFLATKDRSEFVLSTKVGRLLVPTTEDVEGVDGFYGTPRMTRVRDYSRDGVLASLEASRERLGLERVDIALVHDPDDYYDEAITTAIPALLDLRRAGVVGAVGAGMNQAEMLERFVEAFDIDCVMVAGRYTLLDNSAASLLELCAHKGVGALVAGVFNSGLLANPRPTSTYNYAPAPPHLVARAQMMAEACNRYGVELPAAALQYPLRHPGVTAVLAGAAKPGHIGKDVEYLRAEIPDELFDELDALRSG